MREYHLMIFYSSRIYPNKATRSVKWGQFSHHNITEIESIRAPILTASLEDRLIGRLIECSKFIPQTFNKSYAH